MPLVHQLPFPASPASNYSYYSFASHSCPSLGAFWNESLGRKVAMTFIGVPFLLAGYELIKNTLILMKNISILSVNFTIGVANGVSQITSYLKSKTPSPSPLISDPLVSDPQELSENEEIFNRTEEPSRMRFVKTAAGLVAVAIGAIALSAYSGKIGYFAGNSTSQTPPVTSNGS